MPVPVTITTDDLVPWIYFCIVREEVDARLQNRVLLTLQRSFKLR